MSLLNFWCFRTLPAYLLYFYVIFTLAFISEINQKVWRQTIISVPKMQNIFCNISPNFALVYRRSYWGFVISHNELQRFNVGGPIMFCNALKRKEKCQRNVLECCFNIVSFVLTTHHMSRIRIGVVSIPITASLLLLRFQKVTLIGGCAFLTNSNCKWKLFQNT